MHARRAFRHALTFAAIPLGTALSAHADDPKAPPAAAPKAGRAPKPAAPKPAPAKPATPPAAQGDAAALPPLPDESAAKPTPVASATPTPITPGDAAEVKRAEMGLESRLSALSKEIEGEPAAIKATRAVLVERKRLLDHWKAAAKARDAAEHPKPSPEQQVAEAKAELEKARGMLDQANKAPDSMLPEAFGPPPAGAPAKPPEARLAEMKEAIDAASTEAKQRQEESEKLKAAGAKDRGRDLPTLKAERDKRHQAVSALATTRADREAAIQAASGPEATELARDRYVNFEWEYRVEAERLAAAEAEIALAGRRAELATAQAQARACRVDLGWKLLDLMEKRYAAQSERQQVELKRAVAKEESRAAHTEDVLERYRAQRTAELLELEAQALAYEKELATATGPLGEDNQRRLADKAVEAFEEHKKLLNDGSLSPLDVLMLKNAFRQIGPLRARIDKKDRAEIKGALSAQENGLADSEYAIVNDARDDQYDREALLDKLPEGRHAEAKAMLDAMEVRHLALLERSRDVLGKLARRSEKALAEVDRRIRTLDEEYIFIRTHIFWVRDAEPVGPATLSHAQVEAVRVARGLLNLAAEPMDRGLWGKVSPDFVGALVGLVVLPWPLWLGRRALDRVRLAAPDATTTTDATTTPAAD